MNILRRKLATVDVLKNDAVQSYILFIAFGSSVITATELKCSSNPAIAAHQPHKA